MRAYDQAMRTWTAVLLCSAILVGSLLVARQGWATTGPETVPHVDVVRYAGLWYEVARLPMPFQKKCAADVTATYTLRPNGTVDVLNVCRKANGKVTRAHGTAKLATRDGSNSKLKVTFFWPFSGRYWVLDLDPEYRWAMVGTPDRKYLWVLSRTPKLDPEVLERLLARAHQMGYSTERMIYTKQG